MLDILKKLLQLASVSNPEPGVYIMNLGGCNALDYEGANGERGQLHNQPLELQFTVVETASFFGKRTSGHSIVGAHVDYRYSTTTPLGGAGVHGSTLEPYLFGLINSVSEGMLTATDTELDCHHPPALRERPEGYENYWHTSLYLTISI